MFGFKRFWRGINIVVKTTPENDTVGDLEVTEAEGKLNYHNGSNSSPVLTEDHVATVQNKEISAEFNTILDLEVDNLKAGVLNIDLTTGTPTDTEIPSALAVKTYVDSGPQVDIDDLVALTGVPANSTDLGTFTGVDIPDNSTIKEALQALEDTKVRSSTAGINNGIPVYDGFTGEVIKNTPLNLTDSGATLNGANRINTNIIAGATSLTIFGTSTSASIQIGTDGSPGTLFKGGIAYTAVPATKLGVEPTTLEIFSGKLIEFDSADIATIERVMYRIGGFAAPNPGQEVILVNKGTADCLIVNGVATSGGSKGIVNGTGKNIKLKSKQCLTLIFDFFLDKWLILGGPGGGTSSVTLTAGEDLVKGDVVYISKGSDGGRTAGRIYKADASNDNRIEVLGMMEGPALIGLAGEVIIGGLVEDLSGLTAGTMYFLSAVTPGAITTTPPSTDGQWAISLGIPTSATTFVLNPVASASAQYISGNERTYTIANNQSVAVNFSGLLVDPLLYRGGILEVSICRTSSSGEITDCREIKFSFNSTAGTTSIAEHYSGDDTGVNITLQPSGQFAYTSTNMSGTGYVGDMKLYISKLFTK